MFHVVALPAVGGVSLWVELHPCWPTWSAIIQPEVSKVGRCGRGAASHFPNRNILVWLIAIGEDFGTIGFLISSIHTNCSGCDEHSAIKIKAITYAISHQMNDTLTHLFGSDPISRSPNFSLRIFSSSLVCPFLPEKTLSFNRKQSFWIFPTVHPSAKSSTMIPPILVPTNSSNRLLRVRPLESELSILRRISREIRPRRPPPSMHNTLPPFVGPTPRYRTGFVKIGLKPENKNQISENGC